MRSILSVADLSPSEMASLVERSGAMKKQILSGRPPPTLRGKVVGLLFEKPSTRTRTSFEVATIRLGGDPVYLSASELQLSRGEPVKDTARILGGYLDVIVGRVYSQETLTQLAKHSGRPVVNALSDTEHPTQIISDLFTIKEAKGRLKGLTTVFVGDGNNVSNSLLLGGALTGMNVTVACPEGYGPDQDIYRKAKSLAAKSGAELEVVRDPKGAVAEADVVYTDVWVSMGDESEKEKRMRDFKDYQVSSNLMKAAPKGAIVMHCLPAHRGLEIADDVLEGRQSVAWRQGENKLYGAAASLEFVSKD
ncbi:MAG: ornithine carbamoyltransferase [Nitrososphaerota archaeon]|nr:ornithine carbamoyltransferase [Nitrososphaerota archaeon]